MAASKLQKWFPWVQTPVIINGPMIGVACPSLASEVSKAGGFGFISSVVKVDKESPELTKLDGDLAESRRLLGISSPDETARVGASFITGDASITKWAETALPIIAKNRPAAVWLFAPDGEAKPHGAIIKALQGLEAASRPRVFVQVGNVTAAREAARDGADVLVCQGIDAGGHQFRKGMGVVSLVPEVRRMLDEEDEFQGREIAVVAAGGVVGGKGVAAALALGADGVVMGTRFTVADESIYPDFRKELVLKTRDGGSCTLKSPFNDRMNNSKLWGPLYDGRAIIGEIHEKFLAGASLEECQAALKEAGPPEMGARLINTWAGTGVGMVDKAAPAGEIVKEVRDEAKATIRKMAELV